MEDYKQLDKEIEEHFGEQGIAITTECSCSFSDAPEPKWHSSDCTYRLAWESFNGHVHMTKNQLATAIYLRKCKRMVIRDYYFTEDDIEMFRYRGWL